MPDELPVFTRWLEFLNWLLPTTEKFPKKVRFTLAQRIDNLALDVVEDLVEARYTRQKEIPLGRTNLRLEKLRVLLRISYQQKHLPSRQYEHAVRVLYEVGSMVGGEPGRGLPIGNLTSQYFANHLLADLDHFIQRDLGASGYLRFMDDILTFGLSTAELHRQRDGIRDHLAGSLRLRLKEKVTWIAPTRDGIPFLGFRIFPRLIRLQGPRWQRARKRIRRREADFRAGKLSAEDLVRSVQSSVAHIEHASTRRLRRQFFEESSNLG